MRKEKVLSLVILVVILLSVVSFIFNYEQVSFSPLASTSKVYIHAGSLLASKSSDNVNYDYYIQDHLGSNRKVLENGQVSDDDFYAFGEEKFSNSDSDYKFTGKELDDTGLYYYGARYYLPDIGRFVQADAVTGSVDSPLSLNRYAYTANNPLKYVDPTGNKYKRIKFSNQQVKSLFQGHTFWYGGGGSRRLSVRQGSYKYTKGILSGGKYHSRVIDFQNIFPKLDDPDIASNFEKFAVERIRNSEITKKATCAGFINYLLVEYAKEQQTTLDLRIDRGTARYLPENAVISSKNIEPKKKYGDVVAELDPNLIPNVAYETGPLASTLTTQRTSISNTLSTEGNEPGTMLFYPRKGNRRGHVIYFFPTNLDTSEPASDTTNTQTDQTSYSTDIEQ